MTNQSQDITEKHWYLQLPQLKCKQIFRGTIAYVQEEEKI